MCDLGGFTHQGVILKGLVCDSGGFTHHDAQGPGPKIPPCVFCGVLQRKRGQRPNSLEIGELQKVGSVN